MAEIIKVYKNGSKRMGAMVACDRCGGNGGSQAWAYTGYTCYKCGGKGKVWSEWIERTAEAQAKLDAKRAARIAKANAEREAAEAERKAIEDARRAEEEARRAAEAARKAISQYVGNVGDKINAVVTFDHSAYFETHFGWQAMTMYVHTFRDENGNALVWKTSSASLGNLTEGDAVLLKGSIKEHGEYKDEKQTYLTRCKVEKAVDKAV